MANEIESEDLALQEEYAQELYAQQAEQQLTGELQDVVAEGKSYQSPSKFKYGILFTLAIIVDACDFLELTGVGWFIAKVISIIGTGLIVLIFFFTGTKQKKAKDYHKKLQDFVQSSIKNIAHAERIAIRIGTWSQRLGKYTGYISRYAPEVIELGAGLFNLIPGWDLIPWMVVGVYLSYRDEKNTLNSARESAEAVEEEMAQPDNTITSRIYQFGKDRLRQAWDDTAQEETPKKKKEYDKAA